MGRHRRSGQYLRLRPWHFVHSPTCSSASRVLAGGLRQAHGKPRLRLDGGGNGTDKREIFHLKSTFCTCMSGSIDQNHARTIARRTVPRTVPRKHDITSLGGCSYAGSVSVGASIELRLARDARRLVRGRAGGATALQIGWGGWRRQTCLVCVLGDGQIVKGVFVTTHERGKDIHARKKEGSLLLRVTHGQIYRPCQTTYDGWDESSAQRIETFAYECQKQSTAPVAMAPLQNTQTFYSAGRWLPWQRHGIDLNFPHAAIAHYRARN